MRYFVLINDTGGGHGTTRNQTVDVCGTGGDREEYGTHDGGD